MDDILLSLSPNYSFSPTLYHHLSPDSHSSEHLPNGRQAQCWRWEMVHHRDRYHAIDGLRPQRQLQIVRGKQLLVFVLGLGQFEEVEAAVSPNHEHVFGVDPQLLSIATAHIGHNRAHFERLQKRLDFGPGLLPGMRKMRGDLLVDLLDLLLLEFGGLADASFLGLLHHGPLLLGFGCNYLSCIVDFSEILGQQWVVLLHSHGVLALGVAEEGEAALAGLAPYAPERERDPSAPVQTLSVDAVYLSGRNRVEPGLAGLAREYR